MNSLRDMRLIGTTDGSGDATITGSVIKGRLVAVEWIDGDLADGVDGTLSMTSTPSGVDQTLLTLSNANSDAWYYPRTLVHSEAGAALTGTSGGDRDMYVLSGKPKLVISSGGAAATGGMILYYYAE